MFKSVFCITAVCALTIVRASMATFEDLPFVSGDYENGFNLSGSEDTINDPWGPGSGSIVTKTSFFANGPAQFQNSYSRGYSGTDGTGAFLYDSWSLWAYSRTTDSTTPGFGNQYSAYPGGGANGSSVYGVAYQAGGPIEVSFSSQQNFASRGLYVANTTYAALDMRDGSGFSKKFGGVSGDDADWFRLTIRGYLSEGLTASVEFYLADFRFADNSQDYILDSWAFVDLSALGTVDSLAFELSSSDNGAFGMNTPSYFALDNLGAIPEPATLGLLLSGLLLLWKFRFRR